MAGGSLEDRLDTGAGGPPVVEAAVERELRQKREEYATVEGALTERIAEYEAAVDELE